MKLAEALLLRSDLQKRFERTKERLSNNAKVQEGDKPAEDPRQLMVEVDNILDELTALIQRINKTNSVTQMDKGMTIADYLARRDALKSKHELLISLTQAAAIKQDRYSKSEVKFRSTIDVADIQKRADQLAKEHRELDARIQQANWLHDLAE